jgi:hypothetical protein
MHLRNHPGATSMETFIFKFGQVEFICQARSRTEAMLKADNYVDREYPMDEPYGWVASTEGPNIFRMSVGA